MAEFQEIPVIELARHMPGFPEDERFTLVRLDDDAVLCEFRSLDHDDLRFLVVTTGLFFSDYEPEISDEDVAALDLESAEDALVLLVLNPGRSLEQTTANLVAPLVVNTRNRRALQVVLDDRRHPIAAPLLG